MGFGGNPMWGYWVGLYPGTPSERALEPHIAALGVPYRTQFPFFIWGVKYFPDFLLWSLGLIIEVDDDSHDDPEKQKADAQRTSAFEAKGWRVLRCTNYEAEHEPEKVIAAIRSLLNCPTDSLRSLALGPGLPPIPDYAKKSKRRKSSKKAPGLPRTAAQRKKRAVGKGRSSPLPNQPPHLPSQTLFPN